MSDPAPTAMEKRRIMIQKRDIKNVICTANRYINLGLHDAVEDEELRNSIEKFEQEVESIDMYGDSILFSFHLVGG
jgi:hypothetical protein